MQNRLSELRKSRFCSGSLTKSKSHGRKKKERREPELGIIEKVKTGRSTWDGK